MTRRARLQLLRVVAENPRGGSTALNLPGACLGQGFLNPQHQTRIALQTKAVIDPGPTLTQFHQVRSRKAAVGAQDDAGLGTPFADSRQDLFHRRQGAIGRIVVGRVQLRPQGNVPAKNVQRLIAVAAVVSVKKASFLLAMHQRAGRVQIQHDLLRMLG